MVVIVYNINNILKLKRLTGGRCNMSVCACQLGESRRVVIHLVAWLHSLPNNSPYNWSSTNPNIGPFIGQGFFISWCKCGHVFIRTKLHGRTSGSRCNGNRQCHPTYHVHRIETIVRLQERDLTVGNANDIGPM